MKTKTINPYKFSELSEDVKKKVIESNDYTFRANGTMENE